VSEQLECDVLIVGGGLVGSALANALLQLPLDIVLVESFDPSMQEQPSFDSRATALANGSQKILDSLSIWRHIRGDAEPILDIHVSERGRFGVARISAREEGVAALGYTVENRILGAALWRPLSGAEALRCIAPADLTDFVVGRDAVVARIKRARRSIRVTTRLLVAADGMRSGVRSALKIGATVDDYEQVAVIFNCAAREPLRGRAFERFTPTGPLAVLPLSRNRAAVVWTQSPAQAEAFMRRDENSARDELQEAFGYRLGSFTRLGERSAYPLSRVRSSALFERRAVLIGNAALSVHPVAGQGFNLALRDVAALADLIADETHRRGEGADVGNEDLLHAHAEWRRRDQATVAGFTHGLVRLFGSSLPGMGCLRGAGLMAFDLIPGAKALLARYTMGRAGRMPRLARGLTLDA
jgi:2-octaprenyl-6-methoxyphenol hydroxylase